MKKNIVCKLIRRHKLLFKTSNLTDREISMVKNALGYTTWRGFLITLLMYHYLHDELPEDGIYIKELNVRFGGTTTIYV